MLVFKRMVAEESLGRMFSYKLELLGERNDLAFEDMIGSNMALRVLFDTITQHNIKELKGGR